MTQRLNSTLFFLALDALHSSHPDDKLAVIAILERALADVPDLQFFAHHPEAIDCSRGHFGQWQIVAPDKVPRRRPTTAAGRAALLHSVAHIEYSAIDMALDHALRFEGMPPQYYADWLKVALDEARHFGMLRDHLAMLGYAYGDFPVHDSLWQMAERTAQDVLARMAMVPRLLEARGLDATPPMQRKLEEAGDLVAARLLAVILADEEDHVRLGDVWFRYLCDIRGLPPEATFRKLITEYNGPWPQSPMNEAARLAAGFSAAELHDLTTQRPPR